MFRQSEISWRLASALHGHAALGGGGVRALSPEPWLLRVAEGEDHPLVAPTSAASRLRVSVFRAEGPRPAPARRFADTTRFVVTTRRRADRAPGGRERPADHRAP